MFNTLDEIQRQLAAGEDSRAQFKEVVFGDHGVIRVLNGSQIANNGLDGISDGPADPDTSSFRPVVFKDSIVTGNGTDASCGVSRTCADLATALEPRLTNTTCDHSYDTNSGFPGTDWNVCTLD